MPVKRNVSGRLAQQRLCLPAVGIFDYRLVTRTSSENIVRHFPLQLLRTAFDCDRTLCGVAAARINSVCLVLRIQERSSYGDGNSAI